MGAGLPPNTAGNAQHIADISGRSVTAPPEVVCARLSADVDAQTGKVTIQASFTDKDDKKTVQAVRFELKATKTP
jgi:hypothetical protein